MKTTLAKSAYHCNNEDFPVYERPQADGSLISGASTRVVEFQESEGQLEVELGLNDELLHLEGRSWADIPQEEVIKRRKDAPAWARLKGFLLRRLRGKAIWVKLDFKAFEKLTGLSDRQIRRAKNTLQERDHDLVFRTVLKRKTDSPKEHNRGWQVIVALKDTLAYDKEPLFEDTDGKSRHLREDLMSSDIERLPDTLSNKKGPKGQQIETTTAKPKFNFFVNNSKLFPETPKLRRFAHFLKRLLTNRHWDNCKIIFRPAHAYNYVLKGLRMGADRDDILYAYGGALESRHQDATDFGLNKGDPTMKWEPSSTASLAIEVLKRMMKRKQQAII